ncbi:hypothetical protein C5167_006434 [Papaver somniferum]|uniref:RRM domain-containing protein n=1 Tax=Papaver somniferum TaxID=3469 RepID=A0A4Y7JDB2_PAPSO|nr:hypothetical protein C5167_006434 [Papaver somniferum]
MSRVYVGNLDPRVSERELEDEFRVYGVLQSVWVARKPPGYAFVEFDDHRDAMDAIRGLDGKNSWRVELSHNSKGGSGGRAGGERGGGGRGGRGGGEDLKCYECGEPGHFARNVACVSDHEVWGVDDAEVLVLVVAEAPAMGEGVIAPMEGDLHLHDVVASHLDEAVALAGLHLHIAMHVVTHLIQMEIDGSGAGAEAGCLI